MEKLYRELHSVLDLLDYNEVREAKTELESIMNKVHHGKY